MHIFTFLRKKEGSLHWYGQRVTALIVAPFILWLIFRGALINQNYNDLYGMLTFFKENYNTTLMIVFLLILWHSKTGLESIVDDYVHHEKTKFLAYSTIKIIILLLIKYIYLFLS